MQLTHKNQYQSFGSANFTAQDQQSAARAAVDSSLVGKVAQNSSKDQSPVKMVASLAAAVLFVLGISKGVNYLVKTNKFFDIAKPFDWIAKKAAGNKTFQSVAGAVKKPVGTLKNKFNNLDIVKHLKNPANILRPKIKMIKQFLLGTKGEAIDTLTDLLKKLFQRDKFMPDLIKALKNNNGTELRKILQTIIKDGGADRVDKKIISKVLSGIDKSGNISPEAAKILRGKFIGKHGSKSCAKLLAKMTGCGKNSTEVKDLMKLVGEIVQDDTKKLENFPKIYEHVRKNFKNHQEMIAFFSDPKGLGGIFERNTGGAFAGMNTNIGEALKKYAILVGDGATSKAGKVAQKVVLRGAEAVSNGVTAPSLMSLLMAAGIYKGVFDRTLEAPKGEKVATFAEEATQDMGMYMLMPASGALAYGAASLRNWGKTPGAKDNLLKKLVRQPAKIMGMGLPDPSNPGVPISKFKGFVGGTLRFLAIVMVLSPLLIQPVIKLCNKIFGKPTKSVLDKEPKESKEQVPPQIEQSAVAPRPYASESNLINRFVTQQTQTPQDLQPVNNEQREQHSVLPQGRSYIPSSEAAQIPPADTGAADAALRRAQIAEDRARKMLSGK